MPLKNRTKIVTVAIIAALILQLSATYTSYAQERDTILKPVKDSLIIQNSDSTGLSKRDSIKAYKLKLREERKKIRREKDSIRLSRPLILETYILEDSLQYKRMILWNHSQYLNSINLINPDTTYNDNFNDYPFLKKDVGATYLGISGSATLNHNYFTREEFKNFKAFSFYTDYSYTPESLPFYNVKSPYTELVYYGTLFAPRQKEESNVKFFHTQNLSPNLNFGILYKRYGGKGLLMNESTDNRTFAITSNYLGKRYVMNAAFLNNSIKRQENGGIISDKDILDTNIDVRTIPVLFDDANNKLKRTTLFLTQSYGIPVRFRKDTLDSSGIDKGTVAYIGHMAEYSSYRRIYDDNISTTNLLGRKFYNDKFYIDPTKSLDSTRVSSFENRLFLRIQPWDDNAIISKIDGGIGYQILSIYRFDPGDYITEHKNDTYNNLYVYAGASGLFKKYFNWGAFGRYDISGYYANDAHLEGRLKFSLYPFKGGVHLSAKALVKTTTPDWYEQRYYSNHYVWNNSFSKTNETQLKANLEIPAAGIDLFFGYSRISNKIYYDTIGNVKQHSGSINILTGYISKNFKLGILHLDNRVLFQVSSEQEVIPLPKISANLRYYLEFNVVKNVLRTQLGADVTYNTKYYAPAYNPALGVFQIQNERKIGNNPYIDIFANLQWKRASIFIKYINGVQGWPGSDYFSANHYIRPQSAIKFGIHWPFYVK